MGNEESVQKLAWEEWAEKNTDPSDVRKKDEALDGAIVLDLSYGNFGGLFCSSTLGEFGAKVIRIEPPAGDVARKFSPFGLKVRDTGLAYIAEGRNKYQVTLNIETEEGRRILATLAKKADFLIETFPAGYMDERGIGYRQMSALNPALIYLSIYTYGQYGALAGGNRPSSDVIAQALSGLPHITGIPENGQAADWAVPTKHGNWMAWYAGGGFAAFACLAALHFRSLTGKGQLIDLSEAEALMRFLDYNCLWYHAFERSRERVGNYDPAVFPYTYVRTKDGYTFLAGFSDLNWSALCNVMKNPELKTKYPTIFDRLNLENEKQIYVELEKWARNQTSDEILKKVQEYDRAGGKGVVATGRVNTPEDTVNEDNWWKRRVFKKVIDPVYGEILLQMPPWKMTETPPRVKTVCKPIGADNDYIYMKYLGFGKAHLVKLQEEGTI